MSAHRTPNGEAPSIEGTSASQPPAAHPYRQHRPASRRASADAEDRFRALAQATGALVWSVSADARSIETAGWTGFTGQSASEVRDWGWLDAIHPDDREMARRGLLDAVEHPHPVSGHIRVRRQDGEYRVMQVRAVPVFDSRKALREWVGVCTDITDQLQQQRALAEYAAALPPVDGATAERLPSHQLLEAISDGFLTVDALGRLTYVNAAVEQVIGRDRAELLGRNVWDVFPVAVGLPFFSEYQRVVREGKPALFEAYYPPLDRWYETRIYPAQGGATTFLVDITSQKRREAEQMRQLAAEREAQKATVVGHIRFQRLMDANVVGILVGDRECVLECNDTFLDMTGYTRADLEDGLLTWERLTPLEQQEPDRQALEAVLASDPTTVLNVPPFEKEYVRADGSTVPVLIGLVELEHEPLSVLCFAVDLSERKRLERALADQAVELDAILQAMADGLLLYDAEGRIRRVNRYARDRLGLAQPIWDLYRTTTFDERAALLASGAQSSATLPLEHLPVRQVLRGEIQPGSPPADIAITGPDGESCVFSVSGEPLYDNAGHINAAVMLLRDVTEERELEQQKAELLRVVAHDLANPVSAMQLYIQMEQRRLARSYATPPDAGSGLAPAVEHAMVRIDRLLRDLQVAVGAEAGALRIEPARIDLAALCRHEAELQQAVTGRTIELRLPEGVVSLLADPERIGQVVANLLFNALKYSPPNREVTLTVSVEREWARVAVTDHGPGIPAHELSQLFHQFHRVSTIQAQRGFGASLGLGLYISRSIVERHGGTIHVESEVGEGSTFWFMLPLPPRPDALPES